MYQSCCSRFFYSQLVNLVANKLISLPVIVTFQLPVTVCSLRPLCILASGRLRPATNWWQRWDSNPRLRRDWNISIASYSVFTETLVYSCLRETAARYTSSQPRLNSCLFYQPTTYYYYYYYYYSQFMDDMVSTNIMNEGYQPWNKRTRRGKNAHAKYGENEIKSESIQNRNQI